MENEYETNSMGARSKVNNWKTDKAKTDAKPHVARNAGNNEWYTPPEYIQAARAVMGDIDIDPASTEQANRTVGAAVFFTAEQDGLKQQWNGRVWLNPPYAQPLCRKFCEMVAERYHSGEIQQAIVLVNNATDTVFFQRMLQSASAVCFPKGRVRFLDINGNPGSPLQGQAVLYFGSRVSSFTNIFRCFGGVCRVEQYLAEMENECAR